MIIVFDAYGTLWDIGRIETTCQEIVGPSFSRPLLDLWRQKQLEYAFLRTVMGRYQSFSSITEDALAFALAKLQLSTGLSGRTRLRNAWFQPEPFPDAIPMLQTLSQWSRLILSNGDPDMLTQGVRAAGMSSLIDATISVNEVQCYKPHPSTYQIVVDRYHVAPNEVYFVSSNGWDVMGASHFGFCTVWVNRQGQPLEVLGATPTYVVTDLASLPTTIPPLPAAK